MATTDFLQSVYEASPAFLQNIGVSLYGVKIYRREHGARFEKLLSEFESHLKWTPSELLAFQDEKLRSLIDHCYENVPYYSDLMKSLHLAPSDIRQVADLAKLPVLTRKQVMANSDKLLAVTARRADRIAGHTSGTTGSPLHLIWDRQVCLIKTVVDWRQKRLAGINPGDKIAFFLGRQVAPLRQTKPPFWRHNWLMNHLFCSSFHLSPANMKHYMEKLAHFAPRALEGYPSTMSILAGYLNQRKETFPLQAVFTSSETLQEFQRRAIEKAFACKVFDFYGMAERVVFATECTEHTGKHINSDFGVVEISGAGPEITAMGQLGRIVATGLHNYSMPLVRYETSDVTSVDKELCRCGCSMPLMSGVTTKEEDIVVTPDGRFVSSSILNAVTHHATAVAESQIVQERIDHIVMRVVPGSTYGSDCERLLLESLEKVFGPEVKVEIETVAAIPRTANGKYRWVISKIPLGF